jgi:hypothetical protein
VITYARYSIRQARCLVVLDTMWGSGGKADPWFTINPYNHSGKRLYRLTGLELGQVWVTNACPEQTTHANAHGRPSARWLGACLRLLPPRARRLPLLVCGKVAQATYAEVKVKHYGEVFFMLHPAARTWTRQELERRTKQLHTLLRRIP